MINNIDDYIYSLLLTEFNKYSNSLDYFDRYWNGNETLTAKPKAHAFISEKIEDESPIIKGVTIGKALCEIETVQTSNINDLRSAMSATSEVVRQALVNISRQKNLFQDIEDVYKIKINGLRLNKIFYSVNTKGQTWGSTLTQFTIEYSLHF